MMGTRSAGVAALALGLATCLSATAQVENRNPNQNRSNRERNQATANQGEVKTIRGVIAGVTVEGETAIDLRTNRAAAVEASYLTIVGSEVGENRQRDRGDGDRQGERTNRNERDSGDRQTSMARQRHNIYIVWLKSDTEIRVAASARNERDRDRDNADNRQANQNANANANANPRAGGNASTVKFDAVEVGDRVEVKFHERTSTAEDQSAATRSHGRHRTYFGDAQAITILSEPGQGQYDRDRDRDRDREGDRANDRDRERNNRQNNQDR